MGLIVSGWKMMEQIQHWTTKKSGLVKYCIHVVVDNMIIIKCQSHNYLSHIPQNTVLPAIIRSRSTNAKSFKNCIHVSHRKCQGFN